MRIPCTYQAGHTKQIAERTIAEARQARAATGATDATRAEAEARLKRAEAEARQAEWLLSAFQAVEKPASVAKEEAVARTSAAAAAAERLKTAKRKVLDYAYDVPMLCPCCAHAVPMPCPCHT